VSSITGQINKNKSDETGKSSPFRVLVVDDSAVIRGFISRWLEEDSDICVVGTASNGQMALNSVVSSDAEVVLLDIEMPVMDGLTALPLLIKAVPDIQILMASSLTKRNAEISIAALGLGAADYVPKPESNRDVTSRINFRRELVTKVKALASTRRKQRGEVLPTADAASDARPYTSAKQTKTDSLHLFKAVPGAAAEIKFVQPSKCIPKILAIGASTGGPQALVKFLSVAKDFINIPVVITQHMPPSFTAILAQHISRATGKDAHEGIDGEALKPGCIYVAPGDYHMIVRKEHDVVRIRLNQDPPENYCRPSVDPMFRSIASIYGDKVLSVILTGMGHDGLVGGRVVVKSGGTLIAQDEASSIVWGMPGSVAVAGICSSVLPLEDLGSAVGRLILGGKL
jgi:two-component system chemotaxis response regulator CheB